MAIVTYPLNNVEYHAEDAELFHVTRTSGIYASNSFPCTATGADNTLLIGKGIGWIKNDEFAGKVFAMKESVSINLGLSDPIYPRIDAVSIVFDANKNNTEIVVHRGTASLNPEEPIVNRNSQLYELRLYHVMRTAGSQHITQEDIVDLRMDPKYCGLMADSVTQIDFEAIISQIRNILKETDFRELPIVTEEDNGKVLGVKNGAWETSDSVSAEIVKMEDGGTLPAFLVFTKAEIGAIPVIEKLRIYNFDTIDEGYHQVELPLEIVKKRVSFGLTYNVYFDGKVYSCVCEKLEKNESILVIGNQSLIKASVENTNEPFLFLQRIGQDGDYFYIVAEGETAEYHDVGIYEK